MASDKSYMTLMLYSHLYCITVYHVHACGLSLSALTAPICTLPYSCVRNQLTVAVNCPCVLICLHGIRDIYYGTDI